MGIDIKAGGRNKRCQKKDSKSNNLYYQLLIKVFRFLSRRTSSKFSQTVLKRLIQSRTYRPPISLSKLSSYMKGKEDQTAVIVGNVTNDQRMLDMGKLKVCALKFTETARARILKAGGQCITFDQLVLNNPKGSNTVLLRGEQNRQAKKHFGRAPGLPHSHTKPYTGHMKRSLAKKPGKRCA